MALESNHVETCDVCQIPREKFAVVVSSDNTVRVKICLECWAKIASYVKITYDNEFSASLIEMGIRQTKHVKGNLVIIGAEIASD